MSTIVENGDLIRLFGGAFELVAHGAGTGRFNMDYDMERTRDVASGSALPMFRLYAWQPWAVSLGANQKENEIDAGECEKRNFSIVRRPTGGRAVLHANEITYSVVLKLPQGMTVHDVYRDIHMLLLLGLKSAGFAELDFEKSQADFRNFYKDSGMSVSCFASSARYEIAARGRKVIGSAQRLFGDTLLQHGSILIGPGHEQLADVSSTKTEDHKKMLKDYILKHSITLSEISGRMPSFDECASAVMDTIMNYEAVNAIE